MGGTVRERVRENMRIELAKQVFTLFAERGLGNVTAQEAARAAGISRATFFRYFSSKEDAVVTAVRAMNAQFAKTLQSLIAGEGESLLELLRRSFEPFVVEAEQEPEALRRRIELAWSTAALRASWHESRRVQQHQLARALERFCANPRQAETSSVLALTLLDHAMERWLAEQGGTLRAALDEAFDFASMIDDRWTGDT